MRREIAERVSPCFTVITVGFETTGFGFGLDFAVVFGFEEDDDDLREDEDDDDERELEALDDREGGGVSATGSL